MIELVLVCHEDLSFKLLEVAECLLRHKERCWPVGIRDGAHPDAHKTLVEKALAEAGAQGDPVLILTDLFGGTACNVSLPYLRPDKVEVLSGINLAMLLRAFQRRKLVAGITLNELALECAKYASSGIRICSADFQMRNLNLETAEKKAKKNVSGS
jgi:PTS system mannose-specific IIA component